MFSELLKSVLMIVIAFGVRWFFALINVPIDDTVFNSIVAGLVTWLMAQLGYGVTIRLLPGLVSRGLLDADK